MNKLNLKLVELKQKINRELCFIKNKLIEGKGDESSKKGGGILVELVVLGVFLTIVVGLLNNQISDGLTKMIDSFFNVLP